MDRPTASKAVQLFLGLGTAAALTACGNAPTPTTPSSAPPATTATPPAPVIAPPSNPDAAKPSVSPTLLPEGGEGGEGKASPSPEASPKTSSEGGEGKASPSPEASPKSPSEGGEGGEGGEG
jgi:hypothetical protein